MTVGIPSVEKQKGRGDRWQRQSIPDALKRITQPQVCT